MVIIMVFGPLQYDERADLERSELLEFPSVRTICCFRVYQPLPSLLRRSLTGRKLCLAVMVDRLTTIFILHLPFLSLSLSQRVHRLEP